VPWLILVLSAVCEAVWATALSRVDGFSHLVPATLFVTMLITSMVGLSWAAARIPIGTAYAVWTGLGAALTVGAPSSPAGRR
jgi:quaternary ammonium compound-resistance protein SugE